MSIRRFFEIYEICWMFKSHAQQRLAWKDAEEARLSRLRAELMAQAQLQAMLNANPSGQLGNSKLNDEDKLRKAGLL